MKSLLIGVLTCISAGLFAQQFEGTITWDVETDITDPKMKAQMEQAQEQMNDPATQARMKELQEKMNDPQMKAMMESNPQMKAQMEKMMQMPATGGANSMMPKSFMVKIKDNNTLTHMEGGMMAGDVLYINDKSQSYLINKENKTYSVMGKSGAQDKPMAAQVTKTTETATILGHSCTKYKVDIKERGKSITQYIWATTEIKGIDLKGMSKQRMNGGTSMFYDKIDGVPLKMMVTMPEMNMTMIAKEIKKESLPASDFIIPSDYTEVKGMGMN